MKTIFEAKVLGYLFLVEKSEEVYYAYKLDGKTEECLESSAAFKEPKRAVQVAMNWLQICINTDEELG